jgi:hypothetical protein
LGRIGGSVPWCGRANHGALRAAIGPGDSQAFRHSVQANLQIQILRQAQKPAENRGFSPISRATSYLAPHYWRDKYSQHLLALRTEWLPAFADPDVMEQASRLQARPLPPLG